MSIFRRNGDRVSLGYVEKTPYRLVEEQFLEEPYAWNWTVAKAFAEAFRIKFSLGTITLEARYEKGVLGRCRGAGGDGFRIFLRPSMRGHEAWLTLGHELAHTITPASEPSHGDAFLRNLVVVHDFWISFLSSAQGDLRALVIQMVLDHGCRRGRPIGLDENTGPRGIPWTR